MDIQQSWSEFYDRPFPERCAGEELDGVCFVSIDSAAAGCISTFLSNGYVLDSDHIDVLKKCFADLQRILPKLDGDARSYFNELAGLIDGVLTQSTG